SLADRKAPAMAGRSREEEASLGKGPEPGAQDVGLEGGLEIGRDGGAGGRAAARGARPREPSSSPSRHRSGASSRITRWRSDATRWLATAWRRASGLAMGCAPGASAAPPGQ